MNNSVLVTTTNSFEGVEIEKYMNLVSTNIVVGTNFFSDFGASITDLFGGYSDTYQRKLQGIYLKAIDSLKRQSASQGGNAIVGLKIDFDEISGKGKSMFMVSAIGMAVKLKRDSDNIPNATAKNSIDLMELSSEIMKRHIINDVKSKKTPAKEHIEYMMQNPINEIIGEVILLYSEMGVDKSEKEQFLFDNIENILAITDKELTIDALYNSLNYKWNFVFPIIKTLKYLSVKHILDMINNNEVYEAIKCLSIDKETYDKTDLDAMKLLIAALDNIPNTGRIELVKGVLGKPKDKFICEKGHKTDVESEYCCECGINIKGLNYKQVSEIELFKEKVAVLESLLKI